LINEENTRKCERYFVQK